MSFLARACAPTRNLALVALLRRPTVTAAAARPIRPLQPAARAISSNRDQQEVKYDPATGKRIYNSPYDVPLTEQAKEVASDIKEKASDLAADLSDKARELAAKARMSVRKAKRNVNESLKSDDDLPGNSRRLHTSSTAAAATEDREDSLKDKVKKGARHIKDSLKEATGTSQPTRLHPASSAFDEADFESASNPVRAAAASSQLSTTGGGRHGPGLTSGFAAGLWDSEELDEAAAKSSTRSLNEDQDSIAKGIWDGPQEMPQGVGKRAKDEKGRPMETGTEHS